MSPVAVAALLSTIMAFTDAKSCKILPVVRLISDKIADDRNVLRLHLLCWINSHTGQSSLAVVSLNSSYVSGKSRSLIGSSEPLQKLDSNKFASTDDKRD
jgi:hypothetical protein